MQLVAHSNCRARKEGITHSRGMVVYTVTRPAIAPMPNVTLLGSACPVRVRLCTDCLSVVYVVKRTAELAPCRIICN